MTDAAGSPAPSGGGRLIVLVIAAVVVVAVLVVAGVAWVSQLSATATRDRVVAQADVVPIAPAASASASALPDDAGGSSVPTGAAVDPGVPGAASGAALGAAAAATRIDPGWLATTSSATGIPAIALDAYARATAVLATADPGCHLGWNTIAGIGRAESAHGTIDGTTVGADGTASPAIVGPALDGGAYGAIADTDDGVWDGDDRWDHAIGPLQFLPATWRLDGVDASGDGIADPQNLYDASVAAARYLCATGGDLRDGVAWERAIRAYNPADSYVDAVRSAASGYATAAR